MFYNMPDDTSSFFGRGTLLFFTILTNTFLASFGGVQLWDQRPVIDKDFPYALYRPSAEVIASMLCDLPYKILVTAFFNLPFYILANMRRNPAAFSTFYLFAECHTPSQRVFIPHGVWILLCLNEIQQIPIYS